MNILIFVPTPYLLTPLSLPRPNYSHQPLLIIVHFSYRRTKGAFVFWTPVDAMTVPTYYDKIKQPISLSCIRKKIAEYKYSTAAQMQADIKPMADNSETFNGPASVSAYTATGRKLVDKLVASLNHDKKHFGHGKDALSVMEEAIRRKESYLHNKQHVGAPFTAADPPRLGLNISSTTVTNSCNKED